MTTPRTVLDTCVIVSALRSRRGASYRLLELLEAGTFESCLSVALALEYEASCKALVGEIARHQTVFYLWLPVLRDPGDDMVLELAVAAASASIVTFNARDFEGSERLGVKVLSPVPFLKTIGEER